MNEVIHYADKTTGAYLYATDGDAPDNSIVVPAPPTAAHIWNGESWDAPAPVVPESVPMRNAKIALLKAGLLAKADAVIAAIPDEAGDIARIEWRYAQTLRRDHPLVAAFAESEGMTAEQVDDLFFAAQEVADVIS